MLESDEPLPRTLSNSALKESILKILRILCILKKCGVLEYFTHCFNQHVNVKL